MLGEYSIGDLGSIFVMQGFAGLILFSVYVLMALGLAIIFGQMGVINMAHGEFMILGAYVTWMTSNVFQSYLPSLFSGYFFLAMILAFLASGALGMLVEWVLIRHLYKRPLDTLLATWGLSLLLIGLVTLIFGNTAVSMPAPITGYQLGEYQMGGYNLFIILVTVALLIAMWAVLRFTRAGLIARGAMQGADVVSALGYDPRKVYMYTFSAGAALSGLAGGVLAPLTGLLPSSGGAYIAKAFITVITGGAAVISGTLSSAVVLGTVNQLVSFASHPVIGEIAMLVLAIILLRLMPTGITGRFFRDGT